jgi:lipopolysaccharide transport system ATP-binding protein
MTDIAIRASHLGKCFHIYNNPQDRLKQFIFPRLQRLIGRQPKAYFREFWALNDVSFEVKKGETVGIIGRNGSGKSTLLQLICGTLTPSSGQVEINGRVAALLELGSGFNPEFTGRENVYMNASVLGLSQEETEKRFDDIVTFADIGEFIEQPVKTYSSGMMVRLAFAVIAHVDADILVIDEALAVGDVFFTQKCMRFLRNFMKTGTVLFVSHDTGAVVNLCNKAVLLNRGQVKASGTPKQIAELYLETLIKFNQGETQINKAELPVPKKHYTNAEYKDAREALINSSTLRNDIEVFKFDSEKSAFSTGKAVILSVRLLDCDGTPLSWLVGGEAVILEIRCKAYEPLYKPIVGFQFKDRLGQVIFADNTYLTYQFNALTAEKNSELIAKFEFCLPMLPTGDYTFSAAIAEGTQENHVQHHWIHEALSIKVHASSVCLGLMGIPMKKITLQLK